MRLSPGSRIAIAVLLSALTLSAQSSRDQINSITEALRTGRYGDALQLLEPALRQVPTSAQLWTFQGLAYSGKGQKREALTSFRKALKISPDYLPAVEGAAQTAYEIDDPEVATLLRHVVKLVPSDPTAHAMLAALAYKKRDCAGVISEFDKSGSIVESEPVALRQYGICLAREKRNEKAIEIFQKLVSMPGDEKKDRVRLAALQFSAGESAAAIDTLQTALQDVPDTETLALAAESYEEQKDTPQAVKLLHQAIVQDPGNTDLYLQFADLSIVHQSFQVGVDMMTAGLKIQAAAPALYLARGILYVQLADYDHAESDFEKADELDPQHSISEAARGMVAEQKDDLDKALSVVRARLARHPDDAMLLYVEADILVQKNPDVGSSQFNQAVASAKRSVQLQPSLLAARDTLAKLYLQSDKNQLAVEESRTSLQQDPKDQVALYHLIVGLRRTGHKDELPVLLQKLATLRQKATREEGEHNRYKLIEESESSTASK